MKQIFYLFLVVLLCFTSCRQGTKKSTELRVGVMSSMDYVPLAVAQELGFFAEQGVKVDIVKFYSANERDAAFQSGNIDGTVIDYTGAILQKAGDVDLKITSACNSTFCLMTGTESDIHQIADLKNKKISVSRNTVIDFCIEMALQLARISPDDIEKQEINKIPLRFEMMLNGQSDATALPDPFITMAATKGARSIVCMDELGFSVTGIMFKTDAIDQKQDEIKAFYLAYNEAVEYIKTHTPKDIQTILTTDIGFPEALIGAVRLPDYTLAQMPREKDIQVVSEWLQSKGLIPNGFSTSDLLDGHFVQP
ncbi:MAG: ABC transporter substrate-binding protein [Candidatus Symbiothrix sp.]|jgi:NitT/TauT family transport system substrate-binding protein|nr:ABC transporter substrate-binding protein [Candidatus Symbiothrix sp.]